MTSILPLLALLASTGAALAQTPATPAKVRPNILFLFADDQRPDTINAYGNPNIETPTLDRLVHEGFSFRANYCMGSRHGAVCAPSRAMLMSGRSLHHVTDKLSGVTTLPQTLAKAGYTTFGTGKWHNRRPSFLRSFRFGKSIFFGGMSDHNKVPIVDLDPETREFSKRRIGDRFSSVLFADAAIDFLEQHAKTGQGKPFFAYVAFTCPHDPRNPPNRFRKLYYEKHLPLPKNFMPQVEWMGDRTWASIRDEALAPWPRIEKVIRDQLAEYYGLITCLDEQIARILAALSSNGFADNTLIVYSADHGLAMGSHGLLGKQNLYEQSMGCPLILSGPGIPKGKSSDALTYLFDLYATLCDYTDTEAPGDVEGKSLLPIARGEATGVRDSLFTVYRNTQLAVRDARYKLIRYPEINKTLLYDLENDPDELVDLTEKMPGKTEHMMALLREWQKRTDDKAALSTDKPRPAKQDLTGRKRKPDRHQPAWIRKKYFR